MGGYSLAFWDADVKKRYKQFREISVINPGLRDLVLTVLSDPQPDYKEKYPVPPVNPSADPFDISTVDTGDYVAVREIGPCTFQFLYFVDYKTEKVWMTDVDVVV